MSIKHKIGNKLNGLIRRTYWFKEEMFPDCQKFWQYNTFNTEVVNLGSTSAVYAFDYSGLDIKAANWALRHNPLSGDRAILENYFSYLNPDKSYVIIPLCLFSSLAGRYDFMEDRFYTLISPTSVPHFSYKRQQQIKALRQAPFRSFPLYCLYSEIRRIFRREEKELSEEQMVANAEQWIIGWQKEFSLKDFDTPLSLLNKDSIDEAAAILNDIISFCKERNIIPTLVLPPVYHTLAELFPAKARTMLIDDMIDKLEDKTIRFLNYLDNERFTNDRTLFRDSFFLNSRGAKAFTARVLEDLGMV